MKKKKFFNQTHLLFLLVIILLSWTFIAPFIFNNCSSNYIGSGNIGDLIGGLSSPIIGIASIILLYLALIKQIEGQRKLEFESNFKIIYNEFVELRLAFDNLKINNKYGTDALKDFCVSDITEFLNKKDLFNDNIHTKYDNIQIIHNTIVKFNRIFYLMEKLEVQSNMKEFLSKDLSHIYYQYFHYTAPVILNWIFDEKEREKDIVKAKMFDVRNELDGIQKYISALNT